MSPTLTDKDYSYGRQQIDEADIEAVCAVLRSSHLTQGPVTPAFEKALSERLGCPYAIAVSNGTVALYLTALALNWGPGDYVLTSPLTFVATANAIVFAGAQPCFVDVDPDTYVIDPVKLDAKVCQLLSENKRVRAVIGIDFAGNPCDWKALRTVADKYDLQLVDDACHAMGARYANEELCAAKYADATILSFHPVKPITTGEGGAILTANKDLDARLRLLASHGVTKDVEQLEQNPGPWYYEMKALGMNARLTDFQAALGISQLKKLSRFTSERRKIAATYDDCFSEHERFKQPGVTTDAEHSYHLYPLQIDFEAIGIERKAYLERLKQARIYGQVHYIPVHLQPYYKKNYGFKEGDYPVAEAFYSQEISIPIYPGLTESDLRYICQQIVEAASGRSR